MIFGFTPVQILWYFLIYSFCGWIVEVIYCTVTGGKVVNRGFLNGPVCPVYGFGMLTMLFLIRCVGFSDISQAGFPVLFIGGMILASLVEFIAGWALMKLFHARWWDYSDRPFNIGGYICLQFSICWGFGCYGAIKVAHSTFSHVVEGNFCSSTAGMIILGILYMVFLTDFILTLMTVIGLNKKLKELDEMSQKLRIVSNELSEKIGTGALTADQKIGEGRVQMALAKAELRDAAGEKKTAMQKKINELQTPIKEKMGELQAPIKEKMEELQAPFKDEIQKKMEDMWEQLSEKPGLATGRLMKAFPKMKHIDYQELLLELKRRRGE